MLEHDYGHTFAKRKLETNWNKYEDLSEEDEGDPQIMAAKFDEILLAPKSIGEHFTFASERGWEQATEFGTDSLSHDLFTLNLNNLKNGVGRLPFYLRSDLPVDLFDDAEITDMNFRANYYVTDEKQRIKTEKPSEIAEKLIEKNIQSLDERTPEDSVITSTVKTSMILSKSITKLAESTASLTFGTPLKSHSQPLSSKVIVKSNSTNDSENIQEWLDDILNDK